MAGGCLTTAKDVLSLPEVELMALLDAGILTARAAVSRVGNFTCPPCQTVPPPPPLSCRFCRFSLT
jgi:RAD51-like protein 1